MLRSRSRTPSESYGLRRYVTSNGGWVYPPSSPSWNTSWTNANPPTGLTSRETETMDDETHEHAKTRMLQGEIIAGPLEHVKTWLANDPHDIVVLRVNEVGGQHLIHYDLVGGSESSLDWHIPSWPSYEVEKAYAMEKARAKANSPSMSGLVTLAEFKDTLRLFGTLGQRLTDLANGSTGRRVLDYLRKNGRRSVNKRGSYYRAMSREWLQYRYGIRQVAFDIQSAMDAVNKRSSSRMRYTASIKPDDFNDFAQRSGTPFGCTGVNYEDTLRITQTAEVSAGLIVEEVPEGSKFLHDFGLTQILPTVWDLTKYSFVVDMFLNIGDLLKSYELEYHRRLLTSWIVTRYYRNRYKVTEYYPDPSYLNLVPSGTSYKLTNVVITGNTTTTSSDITHSVTRDVNPDPVHLLSFKPELSVQKVVDLLALTSNFRKSM